MQHQEIVFGRAGQMFCFDPPDGRPDASPVPTVHVIANSRVVAATTGSCTIDPASTTLYGDAHSGSTQIRVASVAGFAAGGRYLMTKPEGDREWIEVVAIAGDTLFLRHPLLLRYAGAATIVGCRISIAIDPAWVASLANASNAPGRHGGLAAYILRWTYATGGIEVTGISFADLVHLRSNELVTPDDLERRVPNWSAELRPEHRDNRGADFIAEAIRAVNLEAVGDRHAQRKIRDTMVLRELVVARANVIRLEHEVMHGAPRSAELAIAEQRYRSSYSRLVDVPRYARSQSSYVEPAPRSEPRPPAGSEPGVRRRIPKLTNQ